MPPFWDTLMVAQIANAFNICRSKNKKVHREKPKITTDSAKQPSALAHFFRCFASSGFDFCARQKKKKQVCDLLLLFLG